MGGRSRLLPLVRLLMGDLVVDLFAGPGGWDEGARGLQLGHLVGVEYDLAACQTRAAAGHQTIRGDVAAMALGPMAGRVRGLIASPPCQAYSMAGKREGLKDIDRIVAHANACRTGWTDYDRDGWHDARSPLVLEVLRWALTLTPDWIACEQVPAVLPLWETFAGVLGAHGWQCWTGVLNAADYGVPQTRRRAFLLASRTTTPQPPAPTHAKEPQQSLFGDGLKPWVSMADALGWGATERTSPALCAGGTKSGGADPYPSGSRNALKRERERGAWL